MFIMMMIIYYFCSYEMSAIGSFGADMRWVAAGACYTMSIANKVEIVKMESVVDFTDEEIDVKYYLPKMVIFAA